MDDKKETCMESVYREGYWEHHQEGREGRRTEQEKVHGGADGALILAHRLGALAGGALQICAELSLGAAIACCCWFGDCS